MIHITLEHGTVQPPPYGMLDFATRYANGHQLKAPLQPHPVGLFPLSCCHRIIVPRVAFQYIEKHSAKGAKHRIEVLKELWDMVEWRAGGNGGAQVG